MADIGRFRRHALVYFLSYVLVRGVTFGLTPLYTRAMSPGDFAVVGVANTLISALTIVIGASLYTAIPRLLHDHVDDRAQRRFLGSTFAFSVAVPIALGLLLEGLGTVGWLGFFETVQFKPHLELVIWTAVFANVSLLPTTVYLTTEQPRKVALLNIATATSQIGLTVLFVVGLKQGAVGVLRAGCVSAGLMAVVSTVLMLRMTDLTSPRFGLGAALSYALPIVPHLLANWALSVSDRLVLERHVTPAELGSYSLGYMLAIAVGVVASSLVAPLTAAANRHLNDPEAAKGVPKMGTLVLLGTSVAGLLAISTRHELIRLLAPPAYADASRVVPWVVVGSIFQGVYMVCSTGTWYSKKTTAIPLVTLLSVGVNVGLNLVYVPRYGVIAAAVNTTVGYAVGAGCHAWLAHRLHPIPWEYRKWAVIAIAAVGACLVVQRLEFGQLLVGLVVKSLATLVLFLLGLVLLGFFKGAGLGWLRSLSGGRGA